MKYVTPDNGKVLVTISQLYQVLLEQVLSLKFRVEVLPFIKWHCWPL